MSKWPQYQLKKFAEVKHGFAFKSEFFSRCGKYVLLTPGNFQEEGGFRWLAERQKYYSGDVPNGYVLKKDDLLVAMTEQAPGLLGSAILIPEDDRYLHNQRLGFLQINNKLVSKYFLYHVFNAHIVRKPISESSTGTKVKHTSPEKIGNIYIPIPPIEQQIAIANLLSTWDLAIEKTDRLIVTKEERYSCLLSCLISNNKHPYGHIRDISSEVSKRNSGVSIERVLSVTNRNGFVLPEDHFERRVASSDLSNYKVVINGQYAYNPSRINVGSIARLDNWDVGVLSPMYVVFRLDETKVNTNFFLHWLESHEAKERIGKSAQGSVRETVNFADLGAIPFPLPQLPKQQRIAAILNTARQEIYLLKMQAEAYRRQKRGLMQKLLTGECRVRVG